MTLTGWLSDPFGIKRRKQKQKEKDALAGKTTSGHLNPGQRDRMFREAKERRDVG